MSSCQDGKVNERLFYFPVKLLALLFGCLKAWIAVLNHREGTSVQSQIYTIKSSQVKTLTSNQLSTEHCSNVIILLCR